MRRGLLIVVVALIVVSACASSDSSEEAGASIGEMVMKAWATGDQADIDAVYAEGVRLVLDGESVAEGREQLTSEITGAIQFGNTYEQVGPVSVYEAEDGDLYVGTLVEVAGTGHPDGVPIVGFYRVRDGRVVRHVFMDAEHY